MNPEDWEEGDILVIAVEGYTWVAILVSRSGNGWRVKSTDGTIYVGDLGLINDNSVHISKWDLMTWGHNV